MNALTMSLIGSIFFDVRNVFESYNSLCRIVTMAGSYRYLKAWCIIIMISMTTTVIIIHFILIY